MLITQKKYTYQKICAFHFYFMIDDCAINPDPLTLFKEMKRHDLLTLKTN